MFLPLLRSGNEIQRKIVILDDQDFIEGGLKLWRQEQQTV